MTGITEGEVTVTVTTDEGGFVDSKTLLILNPSTEFNFALRQTVAGTGESDGPNVVQNLVDDDDRSRWSVMPFPQSATVDLREEVIITRTEVVAFENRAYQFIIEGAQELEGPYTTIVDRLNNNMQGRAASPIINTVADFPARFVRITVMSADVYTGPWVSLTDLRIFGVGDRITSVDEVTRNQVLLTPNPASSIVNIEGAEEYDAVSIFDQAGRMVMRRIDSNIRSIDISQLQSGIYVVKFEGDDKPDISRLIKL